MDYSNRAMTLRRGMLPVTYCGETFRPGEPIPCDHPCVAALRGKLVRFDAPDAEKPKRKAPKAKPEPHLDDAEGSVE